MNVRSNKDKLQEIKIRIESELVCNLKDAATNMVFGKGNPDADILFIGEAPGEKEDLQGIPFVGAAGRELDKMLNLIGLTLDDAYVANILKYRPPKNRDPKMSEIISHTPYLVDQISAIDPKVIVTLGNFSTKFVLAKFDPKVMKKVEGISKLHGKSTQISFREKEYTIVPIYHPAAMLYRPKLREEMKQDFLTLQKLLKDKL